METIISKNTQLLVADLQKRVGTLEKAMEFQAQLNKSLSNSLSNHRIVLEGLVKTETDEDNVVPL